MPRLQLEDFNPEAAKPTFSPAPTLQLKDKTGSSETQHHPLLPTSSHCQAPAAAQAPAARSGADWERGAKVVRA